MSDMNLFRSGTLLCFLGYVPCFSGMSMNNGEGGANDSGIITIYR